MNKHSITKDCLTIYDSYKVPKSRFDGQFKGMKTLHPNSDIWKRSICSLKLEWASHNALYALGYKRDHTQNVDFEYPQRLWDGFRFAVLGILVWPFIK